MSSDTTSIFEGGKFCPLSSPLMERDIKASGWMTKAELSRRTGVSRQSVAKYLAAAGAPGADDKGKFDPVAAAFFLGVCHGRATESEGVTKMRERKLELELSRMERVEAMERKEVVWKKTIEPTIAVFMQQLTEDMRNKFEFEGPQRYERLSNPERQQFNAAAVDWIINRVKIGAKPLTT